MIRPTIKTVAAEAGVSTATVSYVLAGRTKGNGSGISPATAERVHAAVTKVGYRPNQAARTIRTGKSNLMMLSLTMLSDPWSLSVSKAVSAAVASAGITPMILADTDWRTAIKRQGADVIFIDAAEAEGDAALLAELGRNNNLVVFSETLEPNGFDVIRSVSGSSMDAAMDHLTATHTKVACLTPRGSLQAPYPTRYGAYLAGLRRAGLEFRPDYVAPFDGDEFSAYEAAVALLSQPDRPTAIFATSDFVAMAAINAAQRMRLSVPGDVAVIGVGNTLQGEVMAPSLSTVGPVDFFNSLAEFLVERAKSDSVQHRILEFPWQLFVRESAPVAP
ncbi:LacI family transcriptional regulator [Arthrobacter alpinus]|uniref:LacI family DNA-binding transcriptional regulator n=1 Tax=Arthrobacter alpinus TaxID=656366 RepID=UPI0005C91D91|nr:LacI family DNA-binding transcriptional regulator [Arthrobacter alpinus]ALV44650.1 LacI family transcriptional regulator [Arthrobacter alpinus]